MTLDKLDGKYGKGSILAGQKGLYYWSYYTGFKESWLGFWLLHLGAEVKGLSLAPNTTSALFDQLDLAQNLSHHNRTQVIDR
ncbi:hypothetical protein MiTs_00458 [Microcystis aeruginosa NIES-2521]|uniref:Uncharacterized protein n=1 Tax=Microcystis aeruginosa NIES-2521 TaxID=2303983 RepID=A0A5A5RZE8_MICAE|nr:hypothetical protein MiTs_00458 [Microcystis aeruginosa NIES-2521]